MTAKQKYRQEIAKLSAAPNRLKEQVAGRLMLYWVEHLKQGKKTKTCAVLLDGQAYTNVLTLEAWSDADQAHAERNLKPLVGKVACLENAKIVNKGKTTVFHSKQIKLAYDRSTVVKPLDNNNDYATALPLLTMPELPKLSTYCAMSLIVCIQTVNAPQLRDTEGGSKKAVANLVVAFQQKKIDVAFWGDDLAKTMSESKKGDVYRLDWITLVVVTKDLFKLVSNSGTKVEQLQGTDADTVRAGLHENLESMSPQYYLTRGDKLNLPASRMSLALVSHMRNADISQDNSEAYKCAVVVPGIYVKEVRALSDSSSGVPYYLGCPQCRKALDKDDGKCRTMASLHLRRS